MCEDKRNSQRQIILISTAQQRGAAAAAAAAAPASSRHDRRAEHDTTGSRLMCAICLKTRCDKCLQLTDCSGHHTVPCKQQLRHAGSHKDSRFGCERCLRLDNTCDDIHNKDAKELQNKVSTKVETKNSSTQDSRHLLIQKISETKDVQTSETDIGKLDLLKLVLKLADWPKTKDCRGDEVIDKKENYKEANSKNAKDKASIKSKTSNLVTKKVCQMSLGDSGEFFNDYESRCTVVDYRRNSGYVNKNHSCDVLLKSKSMSIPQMKIEELKNSLKEKNKAKDAIEEVNRMFANVRRNDSSSEESNRPSLRIGPRILPVVKTQINEENDNILENMNSSNAFKSGKSKLWTEEKDGPIISYKNTSNKINSNTHKCNSDQKKCIYTLRCNHQGNEQELPGHQGDHRTHKPEKPTCKCKCRSRRTYYRSRDDESSANTSSTFS